MPDTFAITIIFILICTVLGAFIKGRIKDRCLKSFSGLSVMLERKDGSVIKGICRIENSGLELFYGGPFTGEEGKAGKSYILYKSEFDNIQSLSLHIDELSGKDLKKRDRILAKTKRPGLCSRLLRRTRNVFGTVRDSVLEVAGLLLGRAKASAGTANILKGHDKHVSTMQQQAVGLIGTAYEPILERYIGKKVILEVTKAETVEALCGILKDYTSEFIELMDVDCSMPAEVVSEMKADLIVPRSIGMVRHFGE